MLCVSSRVAGFYAISRASKDALRYRPFRLALLCPNYPFIYRRVGFPLRSLRSSLTPEHWHFPAGTHRMTSCFSLSLGQPSLVLYVLVLELQTRSSMLCFAGWGRHAMQVIIHRRATINICGHRTLKAPHPVRSAKLSKVSPSQYCGGGPRGNPRCCSSFFFPSSELVDPVRPLRVFFH